MAVGRGGTGVGEPMEDKDGGTEPGHVRTMVGCSLTHPRETVARAESRRRCPLLMSSPAHGGRTADAASRTPWLMKLLGKCPSRRGWQRRAIIAPSIAITNPTLIASSMSQGVSFSQGEADMSETKQWCVPKSRAVVDRRSGPVVRAMVTGALGNLTRIHLRI